MAIQGGEGRCPKMSFKPRFQNEKEPAQPRAGKCILGRWNSRHSGSEAGVLGSVWQPIEGQHDGSFINGPGAGGCTGWEVGSLVVVMRPQRVLSKSAVTERCFTGAVLQVWCGVRWGREQ